MRHRFPFPLAASVVVFAAALLLSVPSRGGEPKRFVIEIDKLAFGDAPVGLHVNDVVEWRNTDIFRHTATARDESFDVDLPPASRGQVVLKRAGQVDYFCRFHPGMRSRLEIAP
jgi:plastocyanin